MNEIVQIGRFTLLVGVTVIFLGAGCSRPEPTRSEEIRPVKTMVVSAGNEPQLRSFPGRVEASRRVDLAFQVPGLLIKLPVKEGQHIAKGGMIGELRQEDFQARQKVEQGQLDQARVTLNALRLGERTEEQLRREAQARAAAAKLANARTELDRYGRLVRSRAVSRSEYELAETSYRVAQEDHKAALQLLEKGTTARKEDIEAQEAVVRGREGRMAEANLQLRDSRLRAPYNGIIAQVLADEGQSIVANSPVVKFQNVDVIDIVVDVPEAFVAGGIRPATARQMLAEFGAAPGRQFPVTIKEITQVADPKTQTFQVRVTMKAPAGITVLPGMTANVTFASRQAGSAGKIILVPVSAVFKQDSGEQVAWVVGPNQIVKCRPVRMGAASDGQIEIVDGLRPGDRIVVAGTAFLREGMKVRDLADELGSGQP